MLAAPAPAMSDAVECSASNSCLGAAQVLAPPAASVHDAVHGVAYSGLGAVHRLTPPAPAVRDAVGRAACLSSLDAALVLAPPAASMHATVPAVT